MSGSRVVWADAASKGTVSPLSKQKASSPAAQHGDAGRKGSWAVSSTNSRGLAGKLSALEDYWAELGGEAGFNSHLLEALQPSLLGDGDWPEA